MTFVNPDPCLGQTQQCGGVKYAFVVQYLCCLMYRFFLFSYYTTSVLYKVIVATFAVPYFFSIHPEGPLLQIITAGLYVVSCCPIFSFLWLFVLLSFSFGNCFVCPSSIYGFWSSTCSSHLETQILTSALNVNVLFYW